MGIVVSDMIKMGEKQLTAANVPNPKYDAEAIYCYLKKCDRTQFFVNWSKMAGDIEIENYMSLIEKRRKRMPLQQIIGSTEFMGYTFEVRENVLIPRMDTEVVVVEAVKLLNNKDSVLDLCSGSGIIGISMYKEAQKEKKNIKVTSADISDDALELTKNNASKNGVQLEKVIKSDLFENIKKKYNMIISNPPYIKSSVIPTLDVEVREYDPILALDGGEDGLNFYRVICTEASAHLKKNGYLVLEIGHDQGQAVAKLLEDTGKFVDIEIGRDLAGYDRVIKARLQGK